jgi:hypothetical protein
LEPGAGGAAENQENWELRKRKAETQEGLDSGFSGKGRNMVGNMLGKGNLLGNMLGK